MTKPKVLPPEVAAETLAARLLEITPMWLHAMATPFRHTGEVDISTMTQMRTLHALHRGPCTFKELISWRKVAPPTLSRTLEALVKRGWVERIPHPHDKRQILLKLTEVGLTEFERIRKNMLQHTTEIVSALNAHERSQLFEGLTALLNQLQTNCPNTPTEPNSFNSLSTHP